MTCRHPHRLSTTCIPKLTASKTRYAGAPPRRPSAAACPRPPLLPPWPAQRRCRCCPCAPSTVERSRVHPAQRTAKATRGDAPCYLQMSEGTNHERSCATRAVHSRDAAPDTMNAAQCALSLSSPTPVRWTRHRVGLGYPSVAGARAHALLLLGLGVGVAGDLLVGLLQREQLVRQQPVVALAHLRARRARPRQPLPPLLRTQPLTLAWRPAALHRCKTASAPCGDRLRATQLWRSSLPTASPLTHQTREKVATTAEHGGRQRRARSPSCQ